MRADPPQVWSGLARGKPDGVDPLPDLGDRVLRYDSASYFLVAVALPACRWATEGTAAEPDMAVSLRLGRTHAGELGGTA